MTVNANSSKRVERRDLDDDESTVMPVALASVPEDDVVPWSMVSHQIDPLAIIRASVRAIHLRGRHGCQPKGHDDEHP